jgi:NADH-quinone oxidoreductase subunit F
VDLHLLDAEPTAEERAAVDALLGEPRSGWEGGDRDESRDAFTSAGGHEARALRHLLLPALQAVQARVGWVSEGALNYVCQRLSVPPADAYGVATFYALLSTVPRPACMLHVCDDIACRCKGAEKLCAELERTVGPAYHVPHGDTWIWTAHSGGCAALSGALRAGPGRAWSPWPAAAVSGCSGTPNAAGWPGS